VTYPIQAIVKSNMSTPCKKSTNMGTYSRLN
jgi:hypothetical protein